MELYDIETPCPDLDSAKCIASACLRAHLIACANLLPSMQSLFCWQGQIDSEDEVLLRMKAPKAHFDAICALIAQHHPYTLPAITALPIVAQGPGVSHWVATETQAANICD